MPNDKHTTDAAVSADKLAAEATAKAQAKRDAIKRAATAPSAAQIDAAKKPDTPKPTGKRGKRSDKPEAAAPEPKPSHRERIARERYTGASKPIRAGLRLSPVMLNKACNSLSDRTRLAMLDIRDAYADKPFSRLDYDAGILGYLCYLGYAEHVAGTGTVTKRDGNVYVAGSDAKFKLTNAAIKYGKAS